LCTLRTTFPVVLTYPRYPSWPSYNEYDNFSPLALSGFPSFNHFQVAQRRNGPLGPLGPYHVGNVALTNYSVGLNARQILFRLLAVLVKYSVAFRACHCSPSSHSSLLSCWPERPRLPVCINPVKGTALPTGPSFVGLGGRYLPLVEPVSTIP
jgi:hypothetical protein